MSGCVVHCRREAYDVYIGGGDDPRTGRPGEWAIPTRTGPAVFPG